MTMTNNADHSPAQATATQSGRRLSRRLAVVLIAAMVVATGAWWMLGRPVASDAVTAQAVDTPATPAAGPLRDRAGNATDTASETAAGPATDEQPAESASSDTAPVDDPAAANDGAAVTSNSIGSQSNIAVVGLSGATLADAPDGAPVADLETGMLLTAHGRTDDSGWLLVETRDGDGGWVETEALFTMDVTDLPAVSVEQAEMLLASNDDGPRRLTLDSSTGEYLMSTGLEAEDGAEATDTATDVITSVMTETVAPMTTDAAGDNPALATASAAAATDDAAAADETPAATRTNEPATATVALTDSRLNVRAGPGSSYIIIAKAYPGESYTALGRDESGEWIRLSVPGIDDGIGWVAADYVTVDQVVSALPVSTVVSEAPIYASESATASVTSLTSAAEPVAAASSSSSTTGSTEGAATATGLNGTLVFQSNQGGTIYAYGLETGLLTSLTTGFDPAISPDGTTVAFTREGGENGLYLIDIDGSNERLIFSGRARLSAPSWSPDGSEILFTRGDEYVECYDLGRAGCLTKDEFAERFPNGAEDEFPLVKQYDYHLAAVDINGENYRDLPALPSARAADWTEAGIVYQSSDGLQITSDDQADDNRLLAFDYLKPFYRDPDWQQNGEVIAFQSMEGSHWEIFTVNADGSSMTALTRPATTLVDELPSNVAPAWSPDGESIVFLSNRADDNSTGPWRLWIMNADGANQRPLDVGVDVNYTFGGEQMVDWGVTRTQQ